MVSTGRTDEHEKRSEERDELATPLGLVVRRVVNGSLGLAEYPASPVEGPHHWHCVNELDNRGVHPGHAAGIFSELAAASTGSYRHQGQGDEHDCQADQRHPPVHYEEPADHKQQRRDGGHHVGHQVSEEQFQSLNVVAQGPLYLSGNAGWSGIPVAPDRGAVQCGGVFAPAPQRRRDGKSSQATAVRVYCAAMKTAAIAAYRYIASRLASPATMPSTAW